MDESRKVHYQPEGMRTVNPYLVVEDAAQLIEFVHTVFGGKVKNQLVRPDGSIMHIEITVGDSVIMAGETTLDYGVFPGSVFVYVPDCNHSFKKAIECGAISLMLPTYMKHAGERYGGVKDLGGNVWWRYPHGRSHPRRTGRENKRNGTQLISTVGMRKREAFVYKRVNRFFLFLCIFLPSSSVSYCAKDYVPLP